MTKAEIVQLVRDYLGFNENLEETIILRHMDISQAKYEGEDSSFLLPWFLFNEDHTATTSVVSRVVSLPSTFIQFDDDWPLSITDAGGAVYALTRKPARSTVGTEAAVGRPIYFNWVSDKVLLYPLSDVAYTITIPHYATSPALSGAATSPWFTHFPRLIIAETLLSIGAAVRDSDLVSLASRFAAAQQQNYRNRVEAMRHSLQEYVMGGEI